MVRLLPLTEPLMPLPVVTPRPLKKLFTVTFLVSMAEEFATSSTTTTRSAPATVVRFVSSLIFVAIIKPYYVPIVKVPAAVPIAATLVIVDATLVPLSLIVPPFNARTLVPTERTSSSSYAVEPAPSAFLKIFSILPVPVK